MDINLCGQEERWAEDDVTSNRERHATRGPSQGDHRTKHSKRKDFG
jgi:hypothetical protein